MDARLEKNEPRLLNSIVLTLPVTLITFAPLTGMRFSKNPIEFIPLIFTVLFVNVLFFLMIQTGKTDKWRAILFIGSAISFPLPFILGLFEERGHLMLLTFGDMARGMTPFCPIAYTQTIGSTIVEKTISFPGSLSGNFSVTATLLTATVALFIFGRGFCGWICFFGGLEDGCSRICKKPTLEKFDPKWLLMPTAVLLLTVFASMATLAPQYCMWICPFKAVSEYPQMNPVGLIFQIGIFLLLFVGFVVVLPLLTKKRTQCAFICPFGALGALFNPITPIHVAIDKEKCVNCGICAKKCQFFALDSKSIEKGKANNLCAKCGKCIDACPKKAIQYTVIGNRIGKNPNIARLLHLYPAYIMLAIIGGGDVSQFLYRILLLVTTGKIVH